MTIDDILDEGSRLRRQSTTHDFKCPSTSKHVERLRLAKERDGDYGLSLQVLYIGIAAVQHESGSLRIGFSTHDGTYTTDFAVFDFDAEAARGADELDKSDEGQLSTRLANYIVNHVRNYTHERLYKFVGAGITDQLTQLSPGLPARLWSELDIVPLEVARAKIDGETNDAHDITADELADSNVRKALMFFGPTLQPRLMVGYRNEVKVDASEHAKLVTLESYRKWMQSPKTWDVCMKYAEDLKSRNIRIAFLSSTPQGGGVALMRHALIRLFRVLKVDCRWYVPKPKPEVFRITKTNHNILQGVADSEERLSEDQQSVLDEWCEQNAKRSWMSKGGPLASPTDGGAHLVIIDDPQMPRLVEIAKKLDPERPVIWRSHIQLRSDLINAGNNPTAEVWQWLWQRVKQADVVISHPVREFVPNEIPMTKLGYMPATTDWVDGLNKELDTYDSQYYINKFNTECFKVRMNKLAFPHRDYIVQIARFDPSKGIPQVLESFAKLRHDYLQGDDPKSTPQLVIAGHGAVDDPDGAKVYADTMDAIDRNYKDLKDDIIVMRLGATDQILNALLAQAKVVLQLSTREGFEVKVSEALHKGIPVIATRAGGLPLQIVDGESGYLVEVGDTDAVAKHMHELISDQRLYMRMSQYAAQNVSDEVSTVGNAMCWMYLAAKLTKGERVQPNGAWIYDMAREAAGLPCEESESRLPREAALRREEA